MQDNHDLVYGKNPVMEALNSDKAIEKLMVLNTLRGELEIAVRNLAKDKGVPIHKVPVKKLDSITKRGNHQGVVAFLSPITFHPLQDLINAALERSEDPIFIVLEGVSDVRNVGAIARSAHVFGVEAIVMPARHTARINEDAIKISSGALLNIPISREANMKHIIETFQYNDIKVIATDINAEVDLADSDLSGPIAFVLGAEDKGITVETRRQADQLIKINQYNDFDSLNVSVAAGIICYEARKIRMASLNS